jgi:hypothetical protein
MHDKLKRAMEQYFHVKRLVLELEGFTALSSLTPRTFNDVRHTLDHILTGMNLEMTSDYSGAEYHYTQAYEHLREYLLNAYEIIAGRALAKSYDKIKSAGTLTRVGKAWNLHNEAITHYNIGRELRTADPEVSLTHLRTAAELTIQARLEVEEATLGHRFMLWWSIAVGVATITNLCASQSLRLGQAVCLQDWLCPGTTRTGISAGQRPSGETRQSAIGCL